MLSFLSYKAGAGILLKYTRLSNFSSAFATSNCYKKNNNEPPQSESDKPSGQSHPVHKRDSVKANRLQRLDRNPPVRFGIIPKAWFDYFYEKTGVTGGYALLFGGMVVLFSKEIIVVNPEFIQAIAYINLMIIIHKLYGQTIYNIIEKEQERLEGEMDAFQEEEENSVKNNIKILEKSIECNNYIATFLPEAKRENVYLQMELAYRERIKAQYMAVKNCLDFQVEKSSIERDAIKRSLLPWLINNVYQSITPEIKHSAVRKSIEDLKDLAIRNAI